MRNFVQALKDGGYKFAITGTQTIRCRTFLEVCAEEDFHAEAYAYLYFRLPIASQVRDALDRLGVIPWRLWLDVEDETYAAPWNYRIDQLKEGIVVCREVETRPGIYTSKELWGKLTGHITAFADLPLWTANYDGEPDLERWLGPYGGWTFPPTIRQYQGTTKLFGVDVDLNVALPDW